MVTVGVDIGGTNIGVMVMGEDDERLAFARMRTPTGGERAHVFEVIDAAIHEAIDDTDVAFDDITAVGIGSPGVVIDGTVGGAANVPGWMERFSLRDGLENRVGKPVRVVNDVTAAAVAEHALGAGQGYDNLLVVWVGTGVGGGLILHGKPYEGGVGGAGEFGHTVVRQGGAVCPCGRRGCVEAYAGRRAIALAIDRAVKSGSDTIVPSLVESRGKQRVTSGIIRDAIEASDPLVHDLVDEGIEALGAGVASAVNLLDVEAVLIGGGLADKLGQRFVQRVEMAMRPHLFMVPSVVEVKPTELADEGGAAGAALIARD